MPHIPDLPFTRGRKYSFSQQGVPQAIKVSLLASLTRKKRLQLN
jgi:hypothetical protein